MTTAEKLKAYMAIKRINGTALSKLIGISEGYGSMILSGKRKLSIRLEASICDKLSIYQAWWEDGTGPILRGKNRSLPKAQKPDRHALAALKQHCTPEAAAVALTLDNLMREMRPPERVILATKVTEFIRALFDDISAE